MSFDTRMIAVGKIIKGVGIRGELKVLPYAVNSKRFTKLTAVWVGREENKTAQCSIESVRIDHSGVVLKLKEIDSRTEADARRGEFVFVAEEKAIVPAKGSFFIHDIIGMKVATKEGRTVGTVQDVMQFAANDVWVVKSGSKEILLPAIKDVIISVDVKRGAIVIHELEGLLE